MHGPERDARFRQEARVERDVVHDLAGTARPEQSAERCERQRQSVYHDDSSPVVPGELNGARACAVGMHAARFDVDREPADSCSIARQGQELVLANDEFGDGGRKARRKLLVRFHVLCERLALYAVCRPDPDAHHVSPFSCLKQGSVSMRAAPREIDFPRGVVNRAAMEKLPGQRCRGRRPATS
jgi:hypothetical protein